jgi:hypothetical protein
MFDDSDIEELCNNIESAKVEHSTIERVFNVRSSLHNLSYDAIAASSLNRSSFYATRINQPTS